MNDLERVQRWQVATKRDYHPIEDSKEYDESGRAYWEQSLSKWIGPKSTVLEFGCGDGRLAQFVQCEQLYITDVSPAAIAATLARVPTAKVFRFDRRVDVMFAANVFIHMTHHMIESTLFFLSRFARRFAIQMPLYEVSREGCDWIDVTTATPQQWIGWCENAGLNVVELYASPGQFAWDKVGQFHHALQICEARE